MNDNVTSLIRTALALIALAFVAWLNASNYDWTEGKMILEYLLYFIGAEFGLNQLKKHFQNETSNKQ